MPSVPAYPIVPRPCCAFRLGQPINRVRRFASAHLAQRGPAAIIRGKSAPRNANARMACGLWSMRQVPGRQHVTIMMWRTPHHRQTSWHRDCAGGGTARSSATRWTTWRACLPGSSRIWCSWTARCPTTTVTIVRGNPQGFQSAHRVHLLQYGQHGYGHGDVPWAVTIYCQAFDMDVVVAKIGACCGAPTISGRAGSPVSSRRRAGRGQCVLIRDGRKLDLTATNAASCKRCWSIRHHRRPRDNPDAAPVGQRLLHRRPTPSPSTSQGSAASWTSSGWRSSSRRAKEGYLVEDA
jgi:hypothetical protein